MFKLMLLLLAITTNTIAIPEEESFTKSSGQEGDQGVKPKTVINPKQPEVQHVWAEQHEANESNKPSEPETSYPNSTPPEEPFKTASQSTENKPIAEPEKKILGQSAPETIQSSESLKASISAQVSEGNDITDLVQNNRETLLKAISQETSPQDAVNLVDAGIKAQLPEDDLSKAIVQQPKSFLQKMLDWIAQLIKNIRASLQDTNKQKSELQQTPSTATQSTKLTTQPTPREQGTKTTEDIKQKQTEINKADKDLTEATNNFRSAQKYFDEKNADLNKIIKEIKGNDFFIYSQVTDAQLVINGKELNFNNGKLDFKKEVFTPTITSDDIKAEYSTLLESYKKELGENGIKFPDLTGPSAKIVLTQLLTLDLDPDLDEKYKNRTSLLDSWQQFIYKAQDAKEAFENKNTAETQQKKAKENKDYLQKQLESRKAQQSKEPTQEDINKIAEQLLAFDKQANTLQNNIKDLNKQQAMITNVMNQ